jgi:hypothetical protein
MARPPVPKGCRGSDFDVMSSLDSCRKWFFSVAADEALRDAMDSVHGLVQMPLWSLHAEIQTKSARVRPGDDLDARIVFTNTTHLPALVDFPDNVCFDLGAYVRGARADLVVEGCNVGHLCSTPPFRVVLEPGGSIASDLTFVAEVSHVCRDVVEDLPPGMYELRVTAHHIHGPCPPIPTGPVATAPLEVD